MKIPFCDFCAKSGSLCQKCKELIDSGKNDALDLTVSRIMLEESSRVRELDKIEFRKAYREGDILLILSNNEGVRIIRDREELVKRLRSEIGSEKVIVVDYRKDQKRKLEELVYPFRIVELSKVWLPGNMTEFKLLIEGKGLSEKHLQLLEKLAKRLGINVRIQAS
ncbi:MAG: transcription elongation factor NusA [Thermoproteota archaeon]